MIDHDDWTRIARFAAGEHTAEEAEATARWINESAARREALAFIQDVDTAVEVGRPQWDTAASWELLAARRNARLHRPLRLIPLTSERAARRWFRARTVAAAVLIAGGALTGLWQLWRTTSAPHPVVATQAAGTMREYVTPRGQRTTFQLPDGSLVILAPASRLRYPKVFGTTTGRRDVYLDGQAFFEVEHDERRPFLVHTARGVAEDLGTKFTVQEYPGDTTVQVIVAEGRVEFRASGRTETGALLRPGQSAELTRSGDIVVRSGIDLGRHLAWTQGRLVFDDTPLREVLPQLSRWYDLDFVLSDSLLGARRLTASVADEAISETLTLLSSTLDVVYERHGRTVTFRSRPRRS